MKKKWWHIFGGGVQHLVGDDRNIEVYLGKVVDGKLD